jgi:hypothetical protein
MAALQEFVERFHPTFPIGAMDPNQIAIFGQWGPRRTFVPMVYLIDKTGTVRSQYMGSDAGLFEGDQLVNLRAAIDKLIAPAGAAKRAQAPARR